MKFPTRDTADFSPSEEVISTNFLISLRQFFYNHDNRYTLGLDEYKMYFYDKELYLKYVGLTREGIRESGRIMNDPEKIRKIIKEDFNSSYIFLDERDLIFTHTYLYNLAKKDNNFKKGYEDAYCSVYRVK